MIRAVLFDVDGTLYRQGPLRARMLAELLGLALRRPADGVRVLRTLRVFREERERLRTGPVGHVPLERLQYEVVGRAMAVDPDWVRAVVEEWMLQRPLRHLRPCLRPGVAALVEACAAQGLRIGAFSDYPPREKVEALGLGCWFELHLASTDPDVDAFKPSPRGIVRACERWEISPGECLYVGDRLDVDAEAARSAGAWFALVGDLLGRRGGALRELREVVGCNE